MGVTRNRERTRERILNAGKRVFTDKGFEAASVSEIARRAGVSKQLVHHHFGTKEALFQEVHETKFRPVLEWQEVASDDPADLIAERFIKRAEDADYTRFLTWEAASGRKDLPGRNARRKRQAETAAVLQRLQQDGRLPQGMDHRFVQLAIVALTTYPLAFSQNTLLMTGLNPTDPAFLRAWSAFLRELGRRLFNGGSG